MHERALLDDVEENLIDFSTNKETLPHVFVECSKRPKCEFPVEPDVRKLKDVVASALLSANLKHEHDQFVKASTGLTYDDVMTLSIMCVDDTSYDDLADDCLEND